MNNSANCRSVSKKPSLRERRLLSAVEVVKLQAVFKVLANDTRLRILHALVRADELRVTDLSKTLGMKPQAISNQLQRLSDLGVLSARREGNNIYYRILNKCIAPILELALCLTETDCRKDVNAVR